MLQAQQQVLGYGEAGRPAAHRCSLKSNQVLPSQYPISFRRAAKAGSDAARR